MLPYNTRPLWLEPPGNLFFTLEFAEISSPNRVVRFAHGIASVSP
jgi:hypothetical protein